MRVFWGIVLGLLLFFPGITLLQWLTRALGLYQSMSLTEGCLVMVLILLSVITVQHWPRASSVSQSRGREAKRAAGSRAGRYDEEESYRSARRSSRRRSRDLFE